MAKTKTDPTGQAKSRRKGEKELNKRLDASQRQVVRMFRDIPRKRRVKVDIQNQTDTTTFYEYEYTSQNEESFTAEVYFILTLALLENPDGVPPSNWYWRDVLERPYTQGVADGVVLFNQMVKQAGIDVPPSVFPLQEVGVRDALLAPEFQEGFNKVLANNTVTIKSLSDRTAAQTMQVINNGIQAGLTPSEITEQIRRRFRVAKSSAKRIVDTEINKAYNNAQMDFVQLAAEESGLRAAVIHVSALLPTTRSTHAARHGNAYTIEAQRKWWDQGANRINCKCSTVPVLIDRQGKVVNTTLQSKIKSERRFFDA